MTYADTDDTNSSIQIFSDKAVVLKKNIIPHLRYLQNTMRYGIDTLMVSLLILKKIEMKVEEGKEKLLAATLLETAAKVHEFKTPKFKDLLIWS